MENNTNHLVLKWFVCFIKVTFQNHKFQHLLNWNGCTSLEDK